MRGKKTKDRSQLVLCGTNDGRILLKELEAGRVCCIDKGTESAYLIDTPNQFYNPEDKQWYQPIGERSSVPIALLVATNFGDLWTLIQQLFKEAKEACEVRKYREAAVKGFGTYFDILMAMVLVGALVRYMLNK